ncbi:hypothetical protein CBR_g45965 [Chara braunii]|uniref:Uncharacterized protein n=1 Tax=Chara braunii TaxID=69332 RepID=A0A388M014_CHABU|nr:hypothetical protein CBR_g45965 [Chara braunii]|eukprot:GBG87809.1 hypothetical protein CBR_g45965 [Chara braunii]
MQELMGGRGMGGAGGGGGGGGMQSREQHQAQEEQRREAEERRQAMLVQILSPEARERLARIALVKPDKARSVEDLLLQGARFGKITSKVTEERLVMMLEQLSEHEPKPTRVTIQRRRTSLDDDF